VLQPTQVLLANVDYREIPLAETLIALYLGMFVFAESAFVLMAMREYLQEILGLEEHQLIAGAENQAAPKKNTSDRSAAGRLRRTVPLSDK